MAPKVQVAVEAMATGGAFAKMGSGSGSAVTAGKESYQTALLPAVPNPANPVTDVHFTLGQPTELGVTVYNQRGARVRQLYQGRLPAGDHLLKWRGRDSAGHSVASGVYFIKMTLPGRTFSQRVAIVR
jgi:hypothetical protein